MFKRTISSKLHNSPPKGLLWSLILFILFLSIFPSLQLLLSAFLDISSGKNSSFIHVISRKSTWLAIYHSLYTSFLGMIISLILGSIFAFSLALLNIRKKGLWIFLFMLPMMIPPQVTALSWLQLFGPSSIFLKSLGFAPTFGKPNPLYSAEGISLLLGIQHAPLVFLTLKTQLLNLPKEQMEAARLSGASLWQIFKDIILPLCRTALIAGAAIAFVSSLGNFGIPAMLGIPASYFVLPTEIYHSMASFNNRMLNEVAALSVLMAFIALVIVSLQTHLQKRFALPLIGNNGRALDFQLGKGRLLVECSLAFILIIILGAPLLALIMTSLVPTLGVPLNLETLTFNAYKIMLEPQGPAWRALSNSLLLSISAAILLTLISIPLAYLFVRYTSRKINWLQQAIDIPYTLPGVVLAIAFILLFAKPLPVIEYSLYGTLGIIFIAYLARFLTICLKPVHNSMLQLDPSMEEAASLSGATFYQRLRHIILPLLIPAAFAGALLVFMTAVNELTVSALLWSTGNETLGVIIFNLDESGNKVLASAISVMVVLLVAVVMLLLNLLGRFLPKGAIAWQN